MTRVLVPVAVLEGGSVSAGLISLLDTVDVTILGYHVLPEQTPPDQARLQYEDRATEALEDLADEFRRVGGDADHRLVFTHDREQTIDRIADEVGADAFAISGVTGEVEQLLVSLSGDVQIDRILPFVAALVGDREVGVTLLLAADDEAAGRERLDSAAETLRGRGVDARTDLALDTAAFEALSEAVPGHDAVVIGEAAPSLRSLVFGPEEERMASASVGPVLVVRAEERTEE